MNEERFPIKSVSKDLLYTKIADAIVEYIKDNDLKAGDKIPSERALAEQMSTGRNSVREAIRILENEHVITVRTGRGAFVAETVPEASVYLKLWTANYEELLEIKYVLERRAVERLCKRIGAQELQKLEESLQKLEDAAYRGEFLRHEDYVFHKHLRQAAGNKAMEQMIDDLIASLDEYAREAPDFGPVWVATIPYHRRLLEAVKKQDARGAAKACRDIFEIDRKVLEKLETIEKEK